MTFASYLNVAGCLSAACILLACESEGPSPEDCSPPADAPSFAVGTGELCFESVEQGQILPMMAGPQGGYHVWMALGCTDCGSAVLVRYTLLDPTTEEMIPGTYELNEASAPLYGDDWPQAAGIQMSMPGFSWDEEAEPPLPKGTAVLLRAQVFDSTGNNQLHDADLQFEVGDIQYWDPCDANPDGDCCNETCN